MKTRELGISLINILTVISIAAIVVAVITGIYETRASNAQVSAARAELTAHQDRFIALVNSGALPTANASEANTKAAGFESTSSANCKQIEVDATSMNCHIRTPMQAALNRGEAAIIRLVYTEKSATNLHCVVTNFRGAFVPSDCTETTHVASASGENTGTSAR